MQHLPWEWHHGALALSPSPFPSVQDNWKQGNWED